MQKPTPAKPADEGQRYIYRPWITLADGTKLWAKQKGKKAFKIPVSDADNDNEKGS